MTIARPFAVSKFELTFAEWDSCAAHGDCDPLISDAGWGRGRRPVIYVTWDDAQTNEIDARAHAGAARDDDRLPVDDTQRLIMPPQVLG